MGGALSGNDAKIQNEERGEALADYWPLISLVGGSALAAWAIADGFASVDMRTFEGVQGYTTTPQRACETQWRSEREGNIK